MFRGVYACWTRTLEHFLMVERVRRLRQEVLVIRGAYTHIQARKTGARNNAKHRLAAEEIGHCVRN